MSRTRNAIGNMFGGVTNVLVKIMFPFIIRTVMIYVVGVNYLGINSLFNSILQVLNVTELGFSAAVGYCLYEPVAQNDMDLIAKYMFFLKKIYRIIGIVVFALGIVISIFLPYLIKSGVPEGINVYVLYYFYLANTVVSYWLFSYKNVLLVVNQHEGISALVDSIISVIQYSVQLIVVVLTRNYYLFVAVLLVCTIVRNLAISIIVDKRYPLYANSLELESEKKKNLWEKVGGLLVQKVCNISRNASDSIVISAFLGLTLVAQYDNYYYILYSISSILGILASSVRAGIGNAIVLESEEKNYADFMYFQFVYLIFSGICTSGLICLYQHFILLWAGAGLLLSNRIMILLCVYFYVLGMICVRNVYDDALGIWWEERKITIVESIVNIILNIWLGKLFGIYGIVIATIISLFVINLVIKSTYIYNLYFKSKSIRDYYTMQAVMVGVTMVVSLICYYITSFITGTDVWYFVLRLILWMVTAGILYLIVLVTSPYWSTCKLLLRKFIKIRRK